MTERFKIHEFDVEVRRRPRQRTLRLRVAKTGALRVTCAMTVPKREIFHFVTSNLSFIEQQLDELKKLAQQYPEKQFVLGETLLFFGRERKLNVFPGEGKLKVKMLAGEFVMSGRPGSLTERREAVRAFYRRAGRKYLTTRLEFFSRVMGVYPKDVSFRSQSTRWGSCSGEGHISLNWRLMAAPAEVIDYVVVHELAHLEHHDHSPRFWRLVEAYSAQHRELKRWLNDNQFAFEFLAKKPSRD